MSKKSIKVFKRAAALVLLFFLLLSVSFPVISVGRFSSPKNSFINIDLRNPKSFPATFTVNQYDNLTMYVTSYKGSNPEINFDDSFKLVSERSVNLPDVLCEDYKTLEQGVRFEYCLEPIKAGKSKISFKVSDGQKYFIDIFIRSSLTNNIVYASSKDIKEVVGTLKPLVLLVDFPDLKANYDVSTPQFFRDILFKEDSKSLYDFYYENSYGKLKVEGMVFGKWVTLSKNYSYYEGLHQGMGYYPNNSQKLVEDAINAITPKVNFADYDGNGDGVVDGIFIIYAGQRPDAKNPNRIYPHEWNITPIVKNGKTISNYTLIPEYRSKPGDTTIGVFCHEFGHMIGGIDLYDLDGLSSQSFDGKKSYGLGKWSVMAYGTYGTLDKFGDCPVGFDPWHKIKFGWVQPTEIKDDTQNIEINPAESEKGNVIKITSPNNPSEYFLIEYRKKTGFDSSLPGEGILIYHVDEKMTSDNFAWIPGENSNQQKHYLVSLVQADGKFDLENCKNLGDKGDPFSCLSDFLSSAQFYNGKPVGFKVVNEVFIENLLVCDFLRIE